MNAKELGRTIIVECSLMAGGALRGGEVAGNVVATLGVKAASLAVMGAAVWLALKWMKDGKLECLRRLVDDRVEDGTRGLRNSPQK